MVLENSPSDHETWSIWCHIGIHVDFTSILPSHTPLVPQALCEANLDLLRLFHQWECYDHGLLERPHQARYLVWERYSGILAAGAGIYECPPVSGMGKKSAGPGIWEESIRYFVLGCRTDPTNAITRISVFRVILVCQGLIFCLWACIYPAWWASWNLPATPHCVGAATEAIMPGAVPGLVGMLWGEEFENSGILW